MSERVSGAELLARLDEAELSGLHWKIMFISGMGFFTDAYDLFIIGVVIAMLKHQWTISPVAEGLVTSTALLASAVGAVLFGRIADMLGRKSIYGYEMLVLAAGAVASARSAATSAGGAGWAMRGSCGRGGGVPPNAGHIAWCAHQAQSLLCRGRQSPLARARSIARHSASIFRTVARRSDASGA